MIDTSIMLCKCNHIVFSAKWLRRENVETDIFSLLVFGCTAFSRVAESTDLVSALHFKYIIYT